MAAYGRRAIAGFGVVISAVIGLIVGLVAGDLGPGLIAALIALVGVGVALGVRARREAAAASQTGNRPMAASDIVALDVGVEIEPGRPHVNIIATSAPATGTSAAARPAAATAKDGDGSRPGRG